MTTPTWHWEQGIKIAIEGMKMLLLLNGGAAIALIAFATEPLASSSRGWLFSGLLAFAMGAAAGALVAVFGYLTQLRLGRSPSTRPWQHRVAIAMAIASATLFCLGVAAAALWLGAVDVILAPLNPE